MRLALEHSGLAPQDVSAVWASSGGYSPADRPEDLAIRRVFGQGVPVQKPKLLLGEPMGAGGPLQAVLALKAWDHPGGGVPARGPVIVNSGSFGGTHFCVVLAPFTA